MIVGQLKEKEEEPEGEVLGDSNTGSSKKIFFFFFFHFSIFFIFFDPIFIGIVCLGLLITLLPPALFLDESEQEGEKERPLTREEEDLDIIRSWVEVGGHPARQEGEAKELLAEVNIFPCLSLSSYLICYQFPLTTFCIFDGYMLFPPSLQGLRLLQGASEKREEARRLEVEAEKMEAEGWEKLREAITGSEAGGFVWTPEGSHFVLLPHSVQTSSLPILPQSWSICFPSAPSGVHRTHNFGSCRPCHCACPSRCNSSYWGRHTGGYATPSYSVGGH